MVPARSRAKCLRCGMTIKSFSRMRKWCVDCRHAVGLERARLRRGGRIDSGFLEGRRAPAEDSA